MRDFHIVFWQEGTLWVAKCLENSIASQGKTKEEAEHNIQEALELSLEDMKENPEQNISIVNLATKTLSLAV